MYRLSQIVLLLVLGLAARSQSPHGKDFRVDCAACHNPAGWEIAIDTFRFDHDTTGFTLEGVHGLTDCRQCHTSLVFSEADNQCISCHQDIHEQTVGSNCARCHNFESWLVDNILEIHEDNGFPLLEAHTTVNCLDCHQSESNLRFDRLGNECINCHQVDYANADNPDHERLGFSNDCARCHTTAPDWSPGFFPDHNEFYELRGAHARISGDCAACHTGDFADAPTECIGCHQEDYNQTQNPNHQAADFSTDCATCHNEDSWVPATFDHDGQFFPIYSGAHEGEWDQCLDCHTDPADYSVFTCVTCHRNPETDNEHRGVNGYVYDSPACLACHPTGSEDDNFDHDRTNFPLTGAHIGLDCAQCHADGFAGTSTACIDCHSEDYDQSLNPNHNELELSTDCAGCHTTDPGWEPATFDIHNEYYALNGAHAPIANDCATCHAGDYVNTPNTCAGCHIEDYNLTTNPDHETAQFSTDCASCHSESTWIPSTFDHDGQYFPIYSGEHEGEWDQCMDCHTNPNNFAEFTCVSCHQNPETDNEHQGVNGYSYNDPACLACHPTGSADDVFDHGQTDFPLTGAHIGLDCIACHDAGYQGTPTYCAACHQMDYDQTNNPDHNELGLPDDCASCHTTEPGWAPASFNIHNDYYVLNGAHAAIANDCATCHNGDYNNTPSTCAGCHIDDYNQTTNPDHQGAGFSTDCAGCHTESAWEPSTFDHDGQYFPIFSGEHNGEWDQCLDCHTDPNNFAVFTCVACHQNPETDNQHQGVNGYTYSDPACLACHPTGSADNIFDHNTTDFPLTGAHTDVDCAACHTGGYQGTSTYCADCHQVDFNLSVNPDHNELGLPNDCAACHSSEPGWAPASFDLHNDYYALNGAHAAIANDCATCHNGDYINTPNTCAGCHTDDYNQTSNPNHQAAGFSTDCASCHTETTWTPANFDHDGQYFPIYSGEHEGEWDQCLDCHTDPNNFALFSCTTCHMNPETDDQHNGVGGYVFENSACLACHPTGSASDNFDHNTTNFPLTGAHIGVDCAACHSGGYQGTSTLCADCHQMDFDQSANPDHNQLGLPNDCATCHTTEPGWAPASFDIHNDYYALNGAHAGIANDCATCHNGNYNNTPNTCAGCHTDDYNATTQPDHQAAQFSTDCASCHNETAWMPSTFDHDGQYFPIYSGEHEGEWDQCMDCHTNPNNFAEFTCTTCHANPETDDQHAGVGGYTYQSTSCLVCHPTGNADDGIDHNMTNFPLTGAHIGVDCNECHASGYQGTSTFCADCHTDNFNQTTNPNHNSLGFSNDCATCHTTDPGWAPAQMPNHDDYWAFTGAHIDIANDCAACHSGNYTNTLNTCAGCHTDDYNQSVDPNHSALGFPTDCATCHTTDPGWAPAQMPNHDDYWALTGAHIDIANDCAACHNGNYTNTPNTCSGCHTDDYNQSTDPDHNALGLPTDCASCHTTDPGWAPAQMPNHDDFYILAGAHAAIANDCAVCHNGSYTNTPNTCEGCHIDDYNQTTNPDHQAAQFSTDCASCHNESAWMPSTFDHDGQYFPIYSGEHEGEWDQCMDCHTNPNNFAEFTCTTCHAQPDTDDEHIGVNGYIYNSSACLACHPTGESMGSFDHNTTNFPLTGSHIGVDCAQCHTNGYQGTSSFCVDCHLTEFNQTTDPNHNGLGFGTDCESCHTTDPGWTPAQMPNHDDYWALTGAHIDIANDCAACHGGSYTNTPNTCEGCHLPDYNQSTNPNHQSLGFPTDCAGCHTTDPNWTPASMPNHDDYYALTGEHLVIANDCAACHNGNYTNTPNTCEGCHLDDYNQSANPSHPALGIPTTCDNCHTTDPDWTPASFPIHDDYWALTGAHIDIANDCAACHNGNYNNTPNQCEGCHLSDYNQTTNPDHAAIGIPTNCDNCHTTDPGWMPASFPIHSSYYLLTGAHAAIANDCAACHSGNYNNTPNTCEGCHIDDYNTATNPNHSANQFPTDCAQCHTESAWVPSTFDHSVYYVLLGAHAGISNDCGACHIGGNYTNTPNTCDGCHIDDYNQTTNPDHAAANFPVDCAQCHTETAWTPSTFDHNQYWVFMGAHTAISTDCNACHMGNYTNTPNTCYGCHADDYDQTTNPNHAAAQFPTDCTVCHNQTAWTPSTFDHDGMYFPIYSGRHQNEWNQCSECHTVPNVYSLFSCIDCHEHNNQSEVDNDHQGVSGYSYNSQACYNCHPTGED